MEIGKDFRSEFIKPSQSVNTPPEPSTTEPAPEPTPTNATEPPVPTPPVPVVDSSPTPTPPTPPEPEPPTQPTDDGAQPPQSDPVPVDAPPTDTPLEQQGPVEYTDDAVLDYLRKKSGKELSSIDDLFKTPDPVDPYANLPEETQQYLKFNAETGRDYEDFQKLNIDYGKMTPLQIAQQKAMEFTDGQLNQTEINEFLEKELGIEDIAELDKIDAARLNAYGKDFIQNKLAEKEKYKQPIAKPEPPKQEGPEMVKLENGMVMPKEAYENMESQRLQYVDAIKNSTDKITSSSVAVKIDDNGTEKIMDLNYDYSKEDKHDMVSYAMDVNQMVQKISGTKEGGIDHAKHQENVLWYDPSFRGKAINSLIHKALAQQAEEFTKFGMNANFNTNKSMPSSGSNGTKVIPIPGTKSNHGVKYSIEQFKTS